MEQDEERQTKLDWYLAQVAAEIRRGHVEHPRKVNVKDFFIYFGDPEQPDRTAKSKLAWGAALKIDLN